MTHLLHISASPRGAASESLSIAETFLDAVRDVRPEVVVDTFDLWDGTLPQFGPVGHPMPPLPPLLPGSLTPRSSRARGRLRNVLDSAGARDFH